MVGSPWEQKTSEIRCSMDSMNFWKYAVSTAQWIILFSSQLYGISNVFYDIHIRDHHTNCKVLHNWCTFSSWISHFNSSLHVLKNKFHVLIWKLGWEWENFRIIWINFPVTVMWYAKTCVEMRYLVKISLIYQPEFNAWMGYFVGKDALILIIPITDVFRRTRGASDFQKMKHHTIMDTIS